MKRMLDIVLSIAALLTLWPLMVIVAVAIFVNMGAPVLFCQDRPGLGGRLFRLVKFRTMIAAIGSDEQRLTVLGRFLRRTSLDELPELINVLKGEMSLVGPRPLLMEYLPLYSPEQARRHEVRPGITGWAQVNGRNAISWEEKFKLDLWYVDNRSLLLDIRVMLMTVWKVLAREGVSAGDSLTMPLFKGSAAKDGSRK